MMTLSPDDELRRNQYDICQCGHYRLQHDAAGCGVCYYQSTGANPCKSFHLADATPEPSPAPKVAKASSGGSKWGNVRTGHYQSKKEAKYAADLALRQQAGEISFWLEQVPIQLPGLTDTGKPYVYRLDFMVFTQRYKRRGMSPGVGPWDVDFVEAKGKDLPLGKMKRKQAEEKLAIHIEVV